MSRSKKNVLDSPAISKVFHSSEARGCFQGTFLALREQECYHGDIDGRTHPVVAAMGTHHSNSQTINALPNTLGQSLLLLNEG